MSRRTRSRSGDDGVVLVMAMVVVIVFGAVAAAIAGYANASFKHTSTVREQTNLRASADAGVRITIDQMIRHQSLCTSFGADPTRLAATPNGATIDVQCDYLSGDAVGASNWALFLTADVGASVPVLHTTSSDLSIGGSMFLADPPATALPKIDVETGADMRINDGDLWYNDDSCGATPPGSITTLTSILGLVPPRSAQCTTSDWRSLVPPVILPPLPADIPTSQGTDVDDDAAGVHCRVFYPGTYRHPPALANNRANYFVSGDYYFEFPSDDSTLVIPNGVDNPVIGGAADPTLGDTATIDPKGCAGASARFDGGGYGVTWFLGGASRINVGLGGKLELFRRRQVAQAVSIATVEEDEGCPSPSTCYRKSTVTADTAPILTTNAGSGLNGSTVVIHGLVSARPGQAHIGGLFALTPTPAFRGGAVLGSLDVTAGIAINLADLTPQPSQTKLVIASTATGTDGTKVTVQAVVDYKTFATGPPQVAINSWRRV